MVRSQTPANRHGRTEGSPWNMPFASWKAAALSAWRESGDDNVGLIAAGVAFYGFLALVPLLGAVVLIYGLLADTQTVVQDVQGLASIMPADTAQLVGEQLMNVVQTSSDKKGIGLLLALGIALFGARNGAGALISALNVAYEAKEKRGFIAVNLLALGITAAAVMVAIVAAVAIATLGHLEKIIPGAPGVVLALGKLLSYLLLLLGGAAGAATLYRFAPCHHARWNWITPGTMFAACSWLMLTFGFGIYVAKFGNYSATYGSLGTVVVLLTWLYLSSYVLLFGAELNSELEKRPERDAEAIGDEAKRPSSASSAVTDQRMQQPARSDPHRQVPTFASRHRPDPLDAASLPRELLSARVGALLARRVGMRKTGMISSGAATLGLSLLRRRGSGRAGAALVAAAILSAWLTRERAKGE
jgi:YihY family inner membrane protein